MLAVGMLKIARYPISRRVELIFPRSNTPDSLIAILIITGGVKGLKDIINFKIVAHELEGPFLEQGDNKVTAANWYGS